MATTARGRAPFKMKEIEAAKLPLTGSYKPRNVWLGRLDSNQGMAESKSAALPLGYAPTLRGGRGEACPSAASGTIAATPGPINAWAAHYIHVLSGILLIVAGVAGGPL
jgi:hypothetical protein